MNMKTRRIAMSLIGVIITGISVAFFKIATFGVDPFMTFMNGLHSIFPIAFGLLYVIVNAILLSFALITDRHYIGIATFINLFLLGYITQFSHEFLLTIMPDPSIALRIFCLLFGILILCFGSAMYITADLGVSTYDAIALVLANKYKVGPFKFIRIGTDLVCVILGVSLFLVSGRSIADVRTIVGIGTIIVAFFMGPTIELFCEKFARPMLNAGKK